MSRNITYGQKVKVIFNSNQFLEQGLGIQQSSFEGYVLHVPCDVGDSYHFELEDRTVLAINPISSEFIGIIVLDEEKEVPF